MSSVTPLNDEFDATLGELCAAYDKPFTNERRAAYRKSLGKLGQVGWARLVDHCIGESGPERMPTTRECWQIYRKLRNWRPPTQVSAETQAPDLSHSERAINGMLVKWISVEVTSGRRKPFTTASGTPRTIPNGELRERVRVIREIAEAHELMVSEGDPEATEERLRASFTAAMARIPAREPALEDCA